MIHYVIQPLLSKQGKKEVKKKRKQKGEMDAIVESWISFLCSQ